MLIAVHGGMKTYRGSPAGARNYVESGRARADDYYLVEDGGIAEHFVVSPDAGTQRLSPLSGDGYEAWVAGVDPATGQPKGRLRNDANAVRFVEVTVNGPKSWSLASELHPDIGAAYDTAQDRAATQVLDWLAHHATTRVGPRGGQVQVPVQQIEAVTVRHRTSRAGDPHRHLHLQISARVFADGGWRGLHTVGVRDSLDAINGIGHAAVATDPQFRVALAAHGFTLAADGEIVELAPFVGAFSARAGQIGRNVERYETAWRAANPGREPDAQQWRTWDARAWADGRPDKVVPRDGAELTRRWVTELQTLGYREQTSSAPLEAHRVGALDRDAAVAEVLTRLAARRSGWNAADIRGEVEHLLVRAHVVTDSAIRTELAEDLTSRAAAACVPLTARVGSPEHIRALTSARVLDVEAELVTRLAGRGAAPGGAANAVAASTMPGLDGAQHDVVTALAGDAQLLVIEGAAGAGKTTALAATRAAIEHRGARLRVVTPTLKAARVAADQVGSDASSAAWLAYQHGHRWDAHGRWTRLRRGSKDDRTGTIFDGPNPAAALHEGDLLLVDEAGMLDQDTARALLTIADEHGARVAMVGDRHQLSAVGRGGVLDLAARWAGADACLTLDRVHRFLHTETTADGSGITVPDEDYARLSLAMRDASDPAAVFDELVYRDRIRVHPNDRERINALAQAAVEALGSTGVGGATVVVADTREHVAQLNAAIRDRLVAAGTVDDGAAISTDVGQRVGRGDRIVTRRNDAVIGVANREAWVVTGVARGGALTVRGDLGERTLPAGYAREHVELAYASTVHGVQGHTAAAAHAAIGTSSSAASAYVAMTRGRERNTAHLVADDVEDAREQWVAVFARDRADLGPAHAATLAAAEADQYARLRPLKQVLDDLHAAWTVEAAAEARLEGARHRRDLLREIVTLTEQRDTDLPSLRRAHADRRAAAQSTTATLGHLERVVTARSDELAAALTTAWDAQRQPARDAARVVGDGAGRFGQRRAAVRGARAELDAWAAEWRPWLPAIPEDADRVVAFAGCFDDTSRHHETLHVHARAAAEQSQPDYLAARDAAQRADQARTAARSLLRQAEEHYSIALQHYGSLSHIDNPAERLAAAEAAVAIDESTLTAACDRVSTLRADPALHTRPGDVVELARADWQTDRDAAAASRELRWAARADRERASIGPRGTGRGGELEIQRDAPGRGISR